MKDKVEKEPSFLRDSKVGGASWLQREKKKGKAIPSIAATSPRRYSRITKREKQTNGGG